jgi:hypothetical protein
VILVNLGCGYVWTETLKKINNYALLKIVCTIYDDRYY